MRVLLTLLYASAFPPAIIGAEQITFRPVTAALLKMDGRQVKLWNVYTAHKKEHLLLVQLGERYLLLDTEQREVVELAPQLIERKGKELRWERKEKSTEAQRTQRGAEKNASRDPSPSLGAGAGGTSEKVLPSEDWSIRDAGRARIIRVRLAAEGRVLEVQLPLAPDQRFY